jgi:hypothetical protein
METSANIMNRKVTERIRVIGVEVDNQGGGNDARDSHHEGQGRHANMTTEASQEKDNTPISQE